MNTSQNLSPGSKRPYKKPEVRVYGDLREITQHVANKSPHFDPPFPYGGPYKTK
jgi:hypothetical protein